MAASEESIEDSPDISKYVILVHGDLRTREPLQATQLHCLIECTSWNHLQHIIFIPGLFHLKMASVHEDETSLMYNVTQLHPKETGIYTMKPGFYFALLKPTLNDLQIMANDICHTYIASHQLDRMCRKHESERDLQLKNALLLNKYFLLGNIAHVETCIVSWILILKAIGKHKYASHMMNFLFNMHFVYLPGLRHAVHYHILINPTGWPMKWRAIDWCVKLNNLFTKVKNGGKNSNHSIEQIILELPLVQVYQNLQGLVQQSFGHAHLTTNHTVPNMRKTFAKLQG
ncbi:hypothetical protein F5141DRAFT_1190106 [Pisolithus sp. B1]|nr:hypothetical protein F5141DRAFT_1190106 [Pisolithus sp. B1]